MVLPLTACVQETSAKWDVGTAKEAEQQSGELGFRPYMHLSISVVFRQAGSGITWNDSKTPSGLTGIST
jgi:hypothetical protein